MGHSPVNVRAAAGGGGREGKPGIEGIDGNLTDSNLMYWGQLTVLVHFPICV